MATEKQIEANRRNAQKSTGPRTNSGKALAGRNSRKHGTYEREPLLPGENSHNLDTLVEAYKQRFQPQNPIESDLVFQLAAIQYRLRRAMRLESSIFDFQFDQRVKRLNRLGEPIDRGQLIGATVLGDAANGNALSKIALYEIRLGQRYERTRKQLDQIQSRHQAQTKTCGTNPIPSGENNQLSTVD